VINKFSIFHLSNSKLLIKIRAKFHKIKLKPINSNQRGIFVKNKKNPSASVECTGEESHGKQTCRILLEPFDNKANWIKSSLLKANPFSKIIYAVYRYNKE
jgi:hypothetical protein